MQGDSVLVRDSESSSYPGFELSRFNCIYQPGIKCNFISPRRTRDIVNTVMVSLLITIYQPGIKCNFSSPRRTRDMVFSSEVRKIIIREFFFFIVIKKESDNNFQYANK